MPAGEPEFQGFGNGLLLRDVFGDGLIWPTDDLVRLHLSADIAYCIATVPSVGKRTAVDPAASFLSLGEYSRLVVFRAGRVFSAWRFRFDPGVVAMVRGN